MPISRAEISTDSALKLMDRMCEHWSKEFPVETEGNQGRIEFGGGVCILLANDTQLNVAVEALDDATLDQLEGLVDNQLESLSGDEELEVVWEE